MIKINKFGKNFLSLGFANIFSQILLFITTIYYARILGTGEFGNITVAQSIVLYFTMITLFGIQTFGTKMVSKNESSISEIVSETTSFRLVISFICIIVVSIIAIFTHKGNTFTYILILFGLTLIPLALNIDWAFNGIQEMKYTAVFNILKTLIPLILVVIFLKKGWTILIPIFTLIGLIIGIAFEYTVFIKRKRYKVYFKVNKDIMHKYVKLGYPFLLSGVLSMISNNVDKIIIGFTRSSSEVGIYQSAYTLISFLMNVCAIIFLPAFPLFVKYYFNKDTDSLINISNQISKIISVIIVPIFAGGIVLSKQIIVLVFGEKYSSAYISLSILLVYILVLFVREIFGYQLNAWGREKTYLKIIFISAALNLVLNLIITPIYGIIAAACITTCTEFVNLIFMQKSCWKVIKTRYLFNLVTAGIPTFFMTLCALGLKYLGIHVIFNIIICMIVYILLCFAFRILSVKELKKYFASGR